MSGVESARRLPDTPYKLEKTSMWTLKGWSGTWIIPVTAKQNSSTKTQRCPSNPGWWPGCLLVHGGCSWYQERRGHHVWLQCDRIWSCRAISLQLWGCKMSRWDKRLQVFDARATEVEGKGIISYFKWALALTLNLKLLISWRNRKWLYFLCLLYCLFFVTIVQNAYWSRDIHFHTVYLKCFLDVS